jgi:aromatic ring-opening dioxygenase catalytic subunit (LigB family)
MSFHNLRAMNDPRAASISATFDAWLSAAATAAPADRDRHLLSWAEAPAARLSHPREEHLLPLMVIAGAAGQDQGRSGWSGSMLGWALSAFHYGVA